jgi:hypothetical protein
MTCLLLFVFVVTYEYDFRDKNLYYKFLVEENQAIQEHGCVLTQDEALEDELVDVLIMLSNVGPDAMFRMALRKE